MTDDGFVASDAQFADSIGSCPGTVCFIRFIHNVNAKLGIGSIMLCSVFQFTMPCSTDWGGGMVEALY